MEIFASDFSLDFVCYGENFRLFFMCHYLLSSISSHKRSPFWREMNFSTTPKPLKNNGNAKYNPAISCSSFPFISYTLIVCWFDTLNSQFTSFVPLTFVVLQFVKTLQIISFFFSTANGMNTTKQTCKKNNNNNNNNTKILKIINTKWTNEHGAMRREKQIHK